MGNGRHSGLPRGISLDGRVVISDTDSERYAEWKQKLVDDAIQDYQSLRDLYPSSYIEQNGLNHTQLQRLVLYLGLAGQGRIAPDASFDAAVKDAALDGVVLYRGSTREAIDNLVSGELPYIGEGIHGDGIYFSTRLSTAHGYGYSRATAFIDKNLARPVSEDRLFGMLKRESDDVRRAFAGDSGFAAYALYKGYNVIHVPGGNRGSGLSIKVMGKTNGEDYYIPLTREILVFREHTK